MGLQQAKNGLLHWKEIYEKSDLRGFIILSLFLQTALIIAAPLRKRTSNSYINVPIWIAYLLADYVASYSVGLIAKSQVRRLQPTGPFENPNLLAFWAPFLLLHLGGPDTITAYALQDNELWLRHLFQLGFQTGAAAYVFILTLATGNLLWPPTLLMLVAGFIKYSERTQSLYFASIRRFREFLLTDPDPGPDFAKLMDVYFSMKQAKLPTKIEMIPEPHKEMKKLDGAPKEKPMEDLEIVQKAYGFFMTFKGLLSDLIFSFRERNQCRSFFLHRTPREAFKIVEVELNLYYEILYTKAAVIQRAFGYACRLVSFLAILSSLVLFNLELRSSHQHFHPFDVGLTYLLLAGAIALDMLSFIMIVYSDWTAVEVTKSDRPNLFMKLVRKLLRVNRNRWPKDLEDSPSWFSRFKDVLSYRRRWSQAIPQYNLIYYCLNQRSKLFTGIIEFFGITNLLDAIQFVRTKRFNQKLRDFIFYQLQMKSGMADDLETSKEIYSGRGDWVLRFEGCGHLLKYITEVDYDESLIQWHIATDLCYYTDKAEDKVGNESFREICKYLSNYMMYLLIMQTTVLSSVAGIGQIRYRDTCAEALKFFTNRKLLGKKKNNIRMEGRDIEKSAPNPTHINACYSILGVNTEAKPVTVKGDRSKSVLFDACILAKDLNELKGRKWEVMSKVWVEMLCYGACNCRAYTHASQLSKGGQLITLVWLLMVHLGLGNQFQISEGHARAKLIVGK